MKTHAIILATAVQLLVALPLLAQYVEQQLPPGIHTLYGVHFTDALTGWALGSDATWNGPGAIVHTNDGGDTWVRQAEAAITATLSNVHFISNLQGWAVGWDGTILHTSDGGQTWNVQNSGTAANLYSVHFINANTGWVVGSDMLLLRTENGGQSWVQQVVPVSAFLSKVQFADEMNGWILGETGFWPDSYAVLLRTTDGGSSWSVSSDDTTPNLTEIHFVDADNGWGVTFDDATIHRTTDGGSNWSLQDAPVVGGDGISLRAVHFSDTNNGYVVGSYSISGAQFGIGFKTTNGGVDWSVINLPNTDNMGFMDVHSPASGLGWVVGTNAFPVGAVVFRIGQAVGLHDQEISVLEFGLHPNPAADRASLTFTLHQQQRVTLEVLDLQGRVVKHFPAGEMPPGEHQLFIDVDGLGQGTYLCRLWTGSRHGTRPLVIGDRR